MRRRDFLTASLATTGGLLLPRTARSGAGPIHRRAGRPLRILFLGGTNFVGPAIVKVALERGHEVTLFNRRETNPWLFTHLERLVGNRYPDRGEGLRALEGDRRWDAVIDTWQESPVCVEKTTRLLRGRADRYAYVSSIAVYQGRNYRRDVLHEGLELPEATMPDSSTVELSYPKRKQLGEAAVKETFPDRNGIFRCYAIPGVDGRGRIPDGGLKWAYWPVRLRQGGEVLAPGNGDDPIQWIDVRDVAEFVVHCLESGHTGTYDLGSRNTMKGFLTDLATLSPRSDSSLTWVPAEFLFEAGLASFTDVPGWVSRLEEESGFFRSKGERARKAGLRPRSAAETFRPVLDAFFRDHSDHDFSDPDEGVAIARREEEILARWHEHRARVEATG